MPGEDNSRILPLRPGCMVSCDFKYVQRDALVGGLFSFSSKSVQFNSIEPI